MNIPLKFTNKLSNNAFSCFFFHLFAYLIQFIGYLLKREIKWLKFSDTSVVFNVLITNDKQIPVFLTFDD